MVNLDGSFDLWRITTETSIAQGRNITYRIPLLEFLEEFTRENERPRPRSADTKPIGRESLMALISAKEDGDEEAGEDAEQAAEQEEDEEEEEDED